MPAVALGDVDADQIADAVRKAGNFREAVLIKGFDAALLERDILIVRRADERPVSAAPVKDDMVLTLGLIMIPDPRCGF